MKQMTLVFAPTFRRALDAAHGAGLPRGEWTYIARATQLTGRRGPLNTLFADGYDEHPEWPRMRQQLDAIAAASC